MYTKITFLTVKFQVAATKARAKSDQQIVVLFVWPTHTRVQLGRHIKATLNARTRLNCNLSASSFGSECGRRVKIACNYQKMKSAANSRTVEQSKSQRGKMQAAATEHKFDCLFPSASLSLSL